MGTKRLVYVMKGAKTEDKLDMLTSKISPGAEDDTENTICTKPMHTAIEKLYAEVTGTIPTHTATGELYAEAGYA